MVEIAQGEVWWAELLDSAGSGPEAPGNTPLPARTTGLPKDSVANASQIVAIDRAFLADRVARLGPKQLAQVLHGIDVVLGR